jgi:Bifunctional DNA primase/polymerase, N-terminal
MSAQPITLRAIITMAQNIARNNGWLVFPMRLLRIEGVVKKVPARSKREGGNGFHDATTDPAQIEWLWKRWPGELIGIRTGETSAFDVLDVDPSHPTAWDWWQDHHALLPPTRTYASMRTGGTHLYFTHNARVGISRGNLPVGVDVRGEGGAIVFWFGSIGSECLDHEQPAEWPDWLLAVIDPPQPMRRPVTKAADPERSIDGILRALAATGNGNRNSLLYWCACRLREKGIGQGEAEALLMPVCTSLGLTTAAELSECHGTIASAYRRAVA